MNNTPNPAFELFKSLRPHQWLKNILLLVPLLAAHQYSNEAKLINVLIAFIAFCLTASSAYLINDLIDINHDRHHVRKKNRPLASGHLKPVIGWCTWPILLFTALALAHFTLPTEFTITIVFYFALTLAYSLKLKQLVILDAITLASLYTIRIIAGTTAITVTLSFWLITFALFIFFSLALIKRFSELKIAQDSNDTNSLLRGRGYYPQDLNMISSLGAASGFISILVLALYIQDGTASRLYHTPQIIWLACPLLLYWISRIWLIAHRGKMHDDPIVFTMTDPASLIIACLFIGVFALATWM